MYCNWCYMLMIMSSKISQINENIVISPNFTGSWTESKIHWKILVFKIWETFAIWTNDNICIAIHIKMKLLIFVFLITTDWPFSWWACPPPCRCWGLWHGPRCWYRGGEGARTSSGERASPVSWRSGPAQTAWPRRVRAALRLECTQALVVTLAAYSAWGLGLDLCQSTFKQELSEDNDARRAATITKWHPRLKFFISRSNLKVKVKLWYHVKGLVTRNAHVQY